MNEPDNPITIALREIAAQAAPPRLSADAAWRAGRRRRWAAMAVSAATVTAAAVLVPLAVRGVTAAAPTSPAAAPGGTMLTETTSSPAGTMTVQVRYQPDRTGARLLSITYSGSSHVSVRHPGLAFSLKEPVAAHRVEVVTIGIRLTQSELRHFTGSVPLRPSVRRLPVVASTLTAVLGGPFIPINHVKHDTTRHAKTHQFHILMQEGLLIIPRK
jgi:hypothetical protein